ncbi:MAG: primosomal protein N' [Gemmatimonadaceae bacterium]|nr:primosomal protein N' [Gemmatimonadaceae bacterium]NUQ93440.1 primosomal protein N' [Gemmatimonadaceae bacterium]NUR19816.1 primosomal protein N' [Gemmatimonadaceae bacterium]NUS96959.1 primosomal protein N' [Gemmatimonadaceae bacterium]
MFVDVALPLPLFQTFTYRVDGTPRHPLVAGSRVVVPLRNKRAIGICLGPAEPPPDGVKTKAIVDVPDPEAALGEPLLALGRWISEYYVVPLGMVLRSMLPAALTGAAVPVPAQKTRRCAEIARELPSLLERDQLFARAKKQREVYELLEAIGGRATVEHLVEQLGVTPGVITALAEKGIIRIVNEVVARDPFASRPAGVAPALTPTPAQRQAIDALRAGAPGDVFLLHGITGSGKTLVYIELLRHVVGTLGKSAIVLVPEIALTPQTVDRFRAVFGDRIAVLHSALSDGERLDEWRALQRGEKRIAVGARSAIFAPLSDLGAIVVDEEHESSYKQGESPRYHAREAAIMRAKLEGAVTVLGSATPSLESWVNAEAGKYLLLELPERTAGGRLPTVAVVDLRRGAPPEKHDTAAASFARHPTDTRIADATRSPARAILSDALDGAIRQTLDRHEQTILLLNRRGYASFIICDDCGDVATCPFCSITLTYHRAPERLVCHYCQHQEPVRERCARCHGKTLHQRGLGTQQVERILAERFPEARIARMDVDTTSGKWAHATILDRVGRGEVDILLGTQMIAKGLDFPNVTLVGVVDADVGINLPDFRASERCFQLLSQVAGRAGRGPKGGQVLIQTRLPTHHAVRCAVTHDYHAFVKEELAGRKEPAYPPNVRVTNLIFSGITERATADLADSAVEWFRGVLAEHPVRVSVLGPAPCPVERIKNRWRWHLVLKSAHPNDMTRITRYFAEHFVVPNSAQLRVAIDRDPVALL